jgi:hypothetical protein
VGCLITDGVVAVDACVVREDGLAVVGVGGHIPHGGVLCACKELGFGRFELDSRSGAVGDGEGGRLQWLCLVGSLSWGDLLAIGEVLAQETF